MITIRRQNVDYKSEIDRLRLRIIELEGRITILLKQIEDLQSRQPGTQIIEKIVEKIVYRDRAPSEMERDVSEHESIEENFEVVGRVKVDESQAVFAKLDQDQWERIDYPTRLSAAQLKKLRQSIIYERSKRTNNNVQKRLMSQSKDLSFSKLYT